MLSHYHQGHSYVAKVEMFCMEEGLDIWQSVANSKYDLKLCIIQAKRFCKQTIGVNINILRIIHQHM
jgi:hypothetical protein